MRIAQRVKGINDFLKNFGRRAFKLIAPGIYREVEDRERVKNWLDTPISPEYPIDPEAKFIHSVIPKSTCFFDVGAHKGIYSLLIKEKVGIENVFLFEPMPTRQKLLKRRFGSGQVFEIALSSYTGYEKMSIPYIGGNKYETRSTLEKDIKEHNQNKKEEIKVRIDTLDNFVDKKGINKMGAIKIDVEGHEWEAIKGGKNTIKKFMPIMVVEIEQRHHNISIYKIVDKIKSWGFSGYFIDPFEAEIRSINEFSISEDQNIKHLHDRNFDEYVNNFIFVSEQNKDNFTKQARRFMREERSHMNA